MFHGVYISNEMSKLILKRSLTNSSLKYKFKAVTEQWWHKTHQQIAMRVVVEEYLMLSVNNQLTSCTLRLLRNSAVVEQQ